MLYHVFTGHLMWRKRRLKTQLDSILKTKTGGTRNKLKHHKSITCIRRKMYFSIKTFQEIYNTYYLK